MASAPRWTSQEDQVLLDGAAEGLSNQEMWERFSQEMGGRTYDSVKKRRELLVAGTAPSTYEGDQAERVRRFLRGEHVPGVYSGPSGGPTFPDWKKPEVVPWREWCDSFKRTQDLYKRIDPSQEVLTVDLRTAKGPVVVVFAADLHLGGGYTDYQEIKQSLEYVMDTKGLYLMLVGDVLEGFIPGNKSAETVEQMVAGNKAQLGAMGSIVEELVEREKLLALTWGDHDAKWWEQLVGVNIPKQTFHDRVPYFNGRGLVRLLVGEEQEYFIQTNHKGSGSSQYNKNHPQKKMDMKFFPADVTVTGHLHSPAFQMEHRLGQLRSVGINLGGKTWYVQTGTFKTGPDPYTIRTWERGILGTPTACFHHQVHDVDLFDAPWKAEAFRQGVIRL